jgi:hypothetical protein
MRGGPNPALHWFGAIAQLGERLHGMQEVSGSIPLGSTSLRPLGYGFVYSWRLATLLSLKGLLRSRVAPAAKREAP